MAGQNAYVYSQVQSMQTMMMRRCTKLFWPCVVDVVQNPQVNAGRHLHLPVWLSQKLETVTFAAKNIEVHTFIIYKVECNNIRTFRE